MKSEIINVSFHNKSDNFSYPIFVGTDLISNCEGILKNFLQNRKIILIHDEFFRLQNLRHKHSLFSWALVQGQ